MLVSPVAQSGIGGGFTGKAGSHTLGGPAALKFTGERNSDIENGKIKEDAPPAQLCDLEMDLAQAQNVTRKHPEQAARMAEHLAELRRQSRSALPFTTP